MVNFRPLKNYMFYCLDEFIIAYNLLPPFLDVGCGTGDLSRYLASKGWWGKAIDYSDEAIESARCNLNSFPQVKIEKSCLFEENGKFETIFLWDVLEHLENDDITLEKISSILNPNGHLLISVPSNPNEWRWDDDFYGHFRRYTVEEMRIRIIKAGMEPIIFWDFTYPLFWFMRRAYTKLKAPPIDMNSSKESKTKASSMENSWNVSIVSQILNNLPVLWQPLYKIQFLYFRNKLRKGHGMFVLARKI